MPGMRPKNLIRVKAREFRWPQVIKNNQRHKAQEILDEKTQVILKEVEPGKIPKGMESQT